jgi:hypothetical protein
MQSLRFTLAAMLVSPIFAADFPPATELPSQPAFPDPLVARDGTRITTPEAWTKKRVPELRALFEHYMYGAQPPAIKAPTKLIREDKAALGGKATLRELHVDLGLAEPVHLMVVIPNERKQPVPCFLGLNFSGNYALLDDAKIEMPKGWVSEKYAGSPANRAGEAGRGKQKDAWAIEQSIDRGYAVATFFNSDVVPDKADAAEPLLRKLSGTKAEERGPADTATIMAWAWAFSRMLDVIETMPEIDAKRVATVGHSRNGKTALLAAAFDSRFAMAVPSQAGCGGTAPNRVAPELAKSGTNGRPTAETVAVINKSFPHWFCGNFKEFNEAPDKLPFDQHELIALCAPRPVLVSNATEDLWANPVGQFDVLKAADPVYRLVAKDGIGAETMPEVGKPLNSRLGYYIRPGKHSMTAEDWKVWLDFADRWLK